MKTFIYKLKERFKREPKKILLIIGFFLFSALTFGLINRPWGEVTSLKMPIDEMIPFMPQFIIIYNLFGPFFLLSGIIFYAFEEDEVYYKYTLALFTGQIIGYIIFYFYQTEIPRPDMTLYPNGIFENMVRFTYSIDNYFAGFPSLHVTDMLILIIATLKTKFSKSTKTWMTMLATLIAITTVLVKQHVFIDIPGGIINGIISFVIASYIVEHFKKK